MKTAIKPKTVKLIRRLLNPLADEGVLSVSEMNEIVNQLKSLSRTGAQIPTIQPRLLSQKEAAEMLGIGLSNFKRLEKEGVIPIKRRMLGTSVRYLNTDVIHFMAQDEDE
jgi:predicted DNA-binding transcriptional regulator AlpA